MSHPNQQHRLNSRRWIASLWIVFPLLTCIGSTVRMHAQQTQPELRQRPQNLDSPSKNSPAKVSRVPQEPSTLPKDISGAYAFDRDNESIEIDLDRGKLTGYITRLGDDETDNTTPLTYFFDKAGVQGSELHFETKVVHGIWYSFIGTIQRGRGQARNYAGYYVLEGKFSVHHPSGAHGKSADETVEQRTVSYKSLGQ